MAKPGPHGPSLLSDELIGDFANLLPGCLYRQTACDMLGVHRDTARRWARRGEKEQDRLAKNPDAQPMETEAIYLKFFVVLKKAVAQQLSRAIAGIQKAGEENWTAYAWIAERRFPELWGSDKQRLLDIQRRLTALEQEYAK
jgi:hypothetical protein